MIPSLDYSIFISFLNDAIEPFWPVVAVVVGIWLGFRILSLFLSSFSRSPAMSGDEGEEQEDAD